MQFDVGRLVMRGVEFFAKDLEAAVERTGAVPLPEPSEAYEVDVLNGPPPVGCTYSAESGTAANAFDGSTTTEWIVGSSGLPRWLRVAYASVQTVCKYGIRARAPFASSDSPRTFTFEGWDGSAWVILDCRAAETGWTNAQLRSFTLAVPASCTDFRLVTLTGSNTAVRKVTLPSKARRITIQNSTGGAFEITVGYATCATVSNGAIVLIQGNGTNCYGVGGAAAHGDFADVIGPFVNGDLLRFDGSACSRKIRHSETRHDRRLIGAAGSGSAWRPARTRAARRDRRDGRDRARSQ